MKELLLYIAKNLVDDPDQVTVTESEGEDGKVLQLHVAPGRHGQGHRAARGGSQKRSAPS